jgi:hypothetical protein
MSEEMYLLDNNALSQLSRTQRASEFFLERCHLPSEVLYEAAGYPDVAIFKQIEYPTTAAVLEFLGAVMATVPEDDTALLNLYANKGAADPLLIACALDARQETSAYLFGPTWLIVSNDKAVQAKATQFGINSCTSEQFASRTRGMWSV